MACRHLAQAVPHEQRLRRPKQSDVEPKVRVQKRGVFAWENYIAEYAQQYPIVFFSVILISPANADKSALQRRPVLTLMGSTPRAPAAPLRNHAQAAGQNSI